VALVAGNSAGVAVLGLFSQVNITGSEAANDRLTVNMMAGDDVLEASGLAAGAIGLTGNGGFGSDVLVGSDGADVLTGGDGDDVLVGGLGLDVLDGGDGDDIIIQGFAEEDAVKGELLVRNFEAGAGSDDKIDLSALAGLSFDWLMAHATTVDGNTVLDLGTGDTMTLLGVTADSLHADDFLLA
jgi:Ca2+-binding RTX toxin-like protein